MAGNRDLLYICVNKLRESTAFETSIQLQGLGRRQKNVRLFLADSPSLRGWRITVPGRT